MDINEARALADQERANLGLANHNAEVEAPVTQNSNSKTPIHTGNQRLVRFARTEAIEKIRYELPILGMEQEIMEAITEHDVVVLSGETGCGKTTQVH